MRRCTFLGSRTCLGCGIELTGDVATLEDVLPKWLAALIRQPNVSIAACHPLSQPSKRIRLALAMMPRKLGVSNHPPQWKALLILLKYSFWQARTASRPFLTSTKKYSLPLKTKRSGT
jgi:hypothetical protein